MWRDIVFSLTRRNQFFGIFAPDVTGKLFLHTIYTCGRSYITANKSNPSIATDTISNSPAFHYTHSFSISFFFFFFWFLFFSLPFLSWLLCLWHNRWAAILQSVACSMCDHFPARLSTIPTASTLAKSHRWPSTRFKCVALYNNPLTFLVFSLQYFRHTQVNFLEG